MIKYILIKKKVNLMLRFDNGAFSTVTINGDVAIKTTTVEAIGKKKR